MTKNTGAMTPVLDEMWFKQMRAIFRMLISIQSAACPTLLA